MTSTPCPHCAPAPDQVNHVVGHIFVGWGHGWQPCVHCGGSGEVQPPPLPPAVARAYRRGLERAIEEIRGCSNALHCAESEIDAVLVIQGVIDSLSE